MKDIPQDAINEALAFKIAIDRLLAAPFGTTAMAVVALGQMAKGLDRGGAAVLLRQAADQIDPPQKAGVRTNPFYIQLARRNAVAREAWVEAERKAAEAHAASSPT